MVKYLSNDAFREEIIKSKEQDELTPEAIAAIMLIANNLSRKMYYTEAADRDDCISGGIMDALLYWRGFKPEKSKNAFAYYTQMIKHGMAKTFNKIHPQWFCKVRISQWKYIGI